MIKCGVDLALQDEPSGSKSVNPNTALRGYNLIIASPFSKTQVDYGFRQLIFDGFINAEKSILHSGIEKIPILACRQSSETTLIKSMESYQKRQIDSTLLGSEWKLGEATEVNVELDIAPVKVGVKKTIEPFAQSQSSNKREMSDLEKFLDVDKGVIVNIEGSCLKETIYIDRFNLPLFRRGFVESVQLMYEAPRVERLKYFKMFIADYGTHYSAETILGARVLFNRKFTQQEQNQMNREQLIKCTKSRFKLALPGIGSTQQTDERCGNTSQEQIVTSDLQITKEQIISYGSIPSQRIEDWSKTLDSVVPLKQRLRPIWELFKPYSLNKINSSMDSSFMLSWFKPLYNNICDIMNYNCYSEESCSNITCPEGYNCISRNFAMPTEKQHFCKAIGTSVYWDKIEDVQGYKITVRNDLFQVINVKMLSQCKTKYCYTVFQSIPNDKFHTFSIEPQRRGLIPISAGDFKWVEPEASEREKIIEFYRIEGAKGYHVTVYDTLNQRVFIKYEEQCPVINWISKQFRFHHNCKWKCSKIHTAIRHKCKTYFPIGWSYYRVFVTPDHVDNIMQHMIIV